MTRRQALGWLAAGTLLGGSSAYAQKPGKELYRIRVTNTAGGAIEASGDAGMTWLPLGKVTRPATAASPQHEVITVTPAGRVAGTSPDNILIRVTAPKGPAQAVRITAKDQPPAASAIGTDIPSGTSLFRIVAPPCSSEVLVDRGLGVNALPATYVPKSGDHLIIVVTQPPAQATIQIENKPGGEVLFSSPGGIPRVLGKVKQPLRGIGRYGNTENGGSGSILSWTPTAVLVSTAGTSPGKTDEERGGFVIQPAEPALKGVSHPVSQLLIEGVPEASKKPPASPFFGLAVPLTSGDPKELNPTRVEVRIDGGTWEPCPDLRGMIAPEDLPRALQQALGRPVKAGITHLRITYGADPELTLQRRLRLAAPETRQTVQRGQVSITANVQAEGVKFVKFILDGTVMLVSNQAPFTWRWDTTKSKNGEHTLEIQGLDASLSVINTVTTKVLVDN